MSQTTRCPKCDTAFLVTADQLALADGHVRCGQCKAIFLATEHFMEADSEPQSSVSETGSNSQVSDEVDNAQAHEPADNIPSSSTDTDIAVNDGEHQPQGSSEHDSTDSSSAVTEDEIIEPSEMQLAPDEAAKEPKDAFQEATESDWDNVAIEADVTEPSETQLTSNGTDETSRDTENQPEDEITIEAVDAGDELTEDQQDTEVEVADNRNESSDDLQVEISEDLALGVERQEPLIGDTEDFDDQTMESLHVEGESSNQLIVPVLEMDIDVDQDFDHDDEIHVRTQAALSEEAFSEPMDSEQISSTQEPIGSSEIEADDDLVKHAMNVADNYQESIEAQLSHSEAELSEEAQLKKAAAQLEIADRDPESRKETLDNLVQEVTSDSNWGRYLAWMSGSLLLLLILLMGLFWFSRFELAQSPVWRPVVDRLCIYLPCGIAAQRDLTKIKLRSREVSLGTEQVQVNMILINEASFNQPYPRISIEFFDLDSRRIATRIMLPSEYLRSDLRHSSMPSNVPVHVEFAFDMQTTEVVGYVFNFL